MDNKVLMSFEKLTKTMLKFIVINELLIFLGLNFSVGFAQESNELVNIFHNQGLIDLKEGKINEAEKSFSYSAKEFAYAPSYFELAKIEFDKNTVYSRQKARDNIQKAIWKDPTNIQYRLLKAKLMEVFSSGIAYDVYEDILDIDPDNVEALFNLGRICEEEFYEYHNSYMNYEESYATSFDSYAFKFFYKAENFFKKAIDADSKRTDSFLHLVSLYEDVGMYEKGIPLIRKTIAADSLNKNAYLFLGYLYYKILKFDSCRIAYKKAFALMDENEKNDFIVTTTQMLSGDNTIDEGKSEELVNNFWKSKDPLYLTKYNERLLEHYSRVAYSNIRFSVKKQNVTGWKSDRGEVMVRYGDPINRMRLRPYINAGGKTQLMLKTDVWVYDDKAFGFTDDYWTGNFRFSEPSNYGRHFSQYLYDTYSYMNYLRKANPEDYVPVFNGSQFTLPYSVTQFKNLGKDGNVITQIYLNYALDVSNNFEFRERYKVQHKSGLFLMDKAKNTIDERIDEYTYLSNDRKLEFTPTEKFWINSLEIDAKPDSGMLAFEVIKAKDNSVSTNHFDFKVKDFSNSDLEISDILLATYVGQSDIKEGSIARKNLGILPNPTQTFTAGIDMYLYYELYNLNQDTEGKTDFEQRITLKKVNDNSVIDVIFSSIAGLFGSRNDDEFTLITDYQSFEKNTQVYLQLDMSKYGPGDYILTVTVEDNLGGKETSEKTMFSWR